MEWAGRINFHSTVTSFQYSSPESFSPEEEPPSSSEKRDVKRVLDRIVFQCRKRTAQKNPHFWFLRVRTVDSSANNFRKKKLNKSEELVVSPFGCFVFSVLETSGETSSRVTVAEVDEESRPRRGSGVQQRFGGGHQVSTILTRHAARQPANDNVKLPNDVIKIN